ncbi:hypothetical protein BGC07_15100 [Piscirickettsia litoralis]|uniref:Uncharacterized protein n=1 Tax=Piscirickettsia litoralis TaxID=1891921 RepID=A0ABX2ZXV6_9GAMM|nr:hypothetical protein BGC07_15100 [Piscirickettsia litoralis]
MIQKYGVYIQSQLFYDNQCKIADVSIVEKDLSFVTSTADKFDLAIPITNTSYHVVDQFLKSAAGDDDVVEMIKYI